MHQAVNFPGDALGSRLFWPIANKEFAKWPRVHERAPRRAR